MNLVVSFLVKMVNQVTSPMKGAIGQVNSLGRAASGIHAPISGVGEQLDQMQHEAKAAAGAVDQVNDELKETRLPAEAAANGIEDVGEEMESTGKKAKRFSEMLGRHLAGGLKVGLIALVTYHTAVIGAISTAATWTHGQAQVAEATLNAAKAAGISATSFQRLQYAFDKSNIGGDALGKTFASLQDRMVTARAGNKEMAAAFSVLGVKVKDSTGPYKAVDRMLMEVADGFVKLTDPVKKAKLAQILFGESGTTLIPLLNQGSKAIKDLGDQAESYGLILSANTLTASQKMNAVWDVMNDRLRGIGLTIFAGLLPPMTGLIEKIGQIIADNKENILKGLTLGLDWLNKNLPSILDGTGKFFAFLSNLVNIAAKVTTAVGGIGNVFDIIAVAAATSWTYSLVTATAAIWGVNSALYAFPGTWIIAAIAAVAIGAYLLIRHWKSVSNFFVGLWDGIKTIFGNAVKWISDNFMSLPLPLKLLALPAMITAHWKDISGFFGRVFGFIGKVWSGLPWWAQAIISLPATIVAHWGPISGFFKSVLGKVGTIWKGLPWWAQAIINLPATIVTHWNQIGPGLAKVWATVKNVFKAGIAAVWDALPDWFKKVLKGVAFGVRFVTGGPDLTKGLPPVSPRNFPPGPPPAAGAGAMAAPMSLPSMAPAQSTLVASASNRAAVAPTGGRLEIAVSDDRVQVKRMAPNAGTQMFVDRGFQGALG